MRRTYLFGHWALTLLLAPFMSQTIDFIFGKNPHQVVGLLEVYPISFLFSIAFSLPTFLIYLACFYFLSKHDVNFIISKVILILISVLGIFITQRIIEGSMSKEIIVAYSVTSLIVGLVLKLNETEKIIDNKVVT